MSRGRRVDTTSRPRARSSLTTGTATKTAIYAALIVWTLSVLFPIYWTVTTSIKPKEANDIRDRRPLPWVDFQPNWKGWIPWTSLSNTGLERTQLFFKHFAEYRDRLAERPLLGDRFSARSPHMDWLGSRIASDRGETMTFRSGSSPS